MSVNIVICGCGRFSSPASCITDYHGIKQQMPLSWEPKDRTEVLWLEFLCQNYYAGLRTPTYKLRSFSTMQSTQKLGNISASQEMITCLMCALTTCVQLHNNEIESGFCYLVPGRQLFSGGPYSEDHWIYSHQLVTQGYRLGPVGFIRTDNLLLHPLNH